MTLPKHKHSIIRGIELNGIQPEMVFSSNQPTHVTVKDTSPQPAVPSDTVINTSSNGDTSPDSESTGSILEY